MRPITAGGDCLLYSLPYCNLNPQPKADIRHPFLSFLTGYLRGYTYDFIELFAPHLTRTVAAKAMHVSPLTE